MEPYQYNAVVTNIVDGDTIDVDIDLGFYLWKKDARIRLKRIDTPEKRTRDLLEKQFGLLATSEVTRLCPVGSTIMLETDMSDKEKFGRVLGIIITQDNVNVNQYLIDNRFAVEYKGQSKSLIKEQHIENYRWLVENDKVVLHEGLLLP